MSRELQQSNNLDEYTQFEILVSDFDLTKIQRLTQIYKDANRIILIDDEDYPDHTVIKRLSDMRPDENPLAIVQPRFKWSISGFRSNKFQVIDNRNDKESNPRMVHSETVPRSKHLH